MCLKNIEQQIDRLPLTNDYVFKRVFGKKGNENIDKSKENEYVDMGYKDEEELATEKLEMHFIELPKFKKKNPGVENKIEQWLWTIIGEEGKIEMAKKDNKEVEQAIKIVDEMSMNKEERELYEARLKGEFNYNIAIHVAKKEGEELGKKAGKLEGKIEGRIEGKTEIAKKLLSKKMPIEEIAEITGLTEEKVKDLKKESM